MSRKKQAALPVPASIDEARALVTEYVEAERSIARARLIAEEVIDAVKQERDDTIARFAEPNAQRFAALKAWWEAGGRDVAGKRRSAELGGVVLGIRLTPPAVKFARGWSVEATIRRLQTLRDQGWEYAQGFLRDKVELDKQAIIKGYRNEEVADVLEGILTVKQTDEFFIDCALPEPAPAPQAEG